ncbi:hypothetical protein FGO68_gene2160 [Halteria grandinella]|uniref:Uncharacterized protein n=1 Tax=Halteria grandinella TaxID=5974 RepID=A0A8J8T504_HALGN|nr:hypothetical protein FGO68_gene2160 [Halteria grandinella]
MSFSLQLLSRLAPTVEKVLRALWPSQVPGPGILEKYLLWKSTLGLSPKEKLQFSFLFVAGVQAPGPGTSLMNLLPKSSILGLRVILGPSWIKLGNWQRVGPGTLIFNLFSVPGSTLLSEPIYCL